MTEVLPVLVSGPAEAETLRVFRSVVASVAAGRNLPYDRVEELRIAVDEATTMVLRAGGPETLTMTIEPAQGRFDTMANVADASGPPKDSRLQDMAKGDIDAAMTDAVVTIDQVYTTPNQVHAAMEPHASVAIWDGDTLTLRDDGTTIVLTRD